MKLLIVNNLASGFGEGAIYDFVRSFVSDGDEVCIRSTDGTTDLASLLDNASAYDAVIASGGDGTVAAVCYELRYSNIPVLPFPAGTANILTLNLASPLEPHALAKLVKSGQTLDFDLGEIEVADKTFGFAIMAGAGYDAAIMHDAKPNKRLLGPMAYFSAAITNPLPEVSKLSITIDGETIEREGLGILIVNFSKIQFDISVTHENEPRDGQFEVVVLKAENAFGLIPAVVAGLLDRGGDFPDRSDALEIHRGSSIEVSADPPMHVQYDGEATELTTPFTARILKGATKLFVSDEGHSLFS
ncbi:diacylglycerol/lipid kinase family protein [Raoultibacter massiliensis]|uniref:Diacylglycerol kinase family protein n=1 Tax=Raoultibacter massiliensis TaxID=1852371 RepID=A0ABV1JAW3_9ACTN|nr:diacylglycerol kinase family protein [Raoultibacter massiliensis]